MLRVNASSKATTMTADDRNKKLKYGTDVPRSWIPDFNATHHQHQAKPVNTPDLLTELDQALRLQRRAIRQGRAKPVTLKQVRSGTCLPKRLTSLAGFLFAGAVGLNIGFHVFSSRVDDKGALREPLFLLPTSAFLVFAGGVSLVGAAMTRSRQG